MAHGDLWGACYLCGGALEGTIINSNHRRKGRANKSSHRKHHLCTSLTVLADSRHPCIIMVTIHSNDHHLLLHFSCRGRCRGNAWLASTSLSESAV